jgi:UDP-2-acetamido-2,6-beta-L-arabino-hexul-4-ose reductase
MNTPKVLTFPLQRHRDNRGYLEEVFRPEMLPPEHREFGQCFLTTARPGIVKGNHYHHSKYELFYLVKGHATVYFKDLETEETSEVEMSEDDPKVLLIPPGPLHAIKNTGNSDFYLMVYTDKRSMEVDQDDQDTFYRAWIE